MKSIRKKKDGSVVPIKRHQMKPVPKQQEKKVAAPVVVTAAAGVVTPTTIIDHSPSIADTKRISMCLSSDLRPFYGRGYVFCMFFTSNFPKMACVRSQDSLLGNFWQCFPAASVKSDGIGRSRGLFPVLASLRECRLTGLDQKWTDETGVDRTWKMTSMDFIKSSDQYKKEWNSKVEEFTGLLGDLVGIVMSYHCLESSPIDPQTSQVLLRTTIMPRDGNYELSINPVLTWRRQIIVHRYHYSDFSKFKERAHNNKSVNKWEKATRISFPSCVHELLEWIIFTKLDRSVRWSVGSSPHTVNSLCLFSIQGPIDDTIRHHFTTNVDTLNGQDEPRTCKMTYDNELPIPLIPPDDPEIDQKMAMDANTKWFGCCESQLYANGFNYNENKKSTPAQVKMIVDHRLDRLIVRMLYLFPFDGQLSYFIQYLLNKYIK